jgi:long-chain fatty acid transport protein
LSPRAGARWLVAAGVAGGLVTGASAASAHEPGAFGVGSRSTAMGGAVAADVSDFSASYYNPAGLAEQDGVRIGFGYFYADQNFTIDGKDVGVKGSHGVMFGLAAGGKVFGIPFGIGIATHIPDEGLSRITALRQDVPRWELYDSRTTVLYLSANLALRPFDWLEVGGGLSFLAATHGRFAISGRADLFSPYDSKLRHEVDTDLSSVRFPQVGALIHLSDTASVALVYRGETSLDLALDGEINATAAVGNFEVPLRYELTARTIQAFLPQQIVVGASWHVVPSLKINADLTWVNWSAYESPTAKTTAKLEADVPPEFPVELPGALKPTKVLDPNFSDRIVPRLGIEWYIPGFTNSQGEPVVKVPVRVGYAFEKSPIPPQTGETNFIDADRHTASVGVGVEIPVAHVSVDAHAAVSIFPERTMLKQSPANLVGDYHADGQQVNVGGTLSGVFK